MGAWTRKAEVYDEASRSNEARAHEQVRGRLSKAARATKCVSRAETHEQVRDIKDSVACDEVGGRNVRKRMSRCVLVKMSWRV